MMNIQIFTIPRGTIGSVWEYIAKVQKFDVFAVFENMLNGKLSE